PASAILPLFSLNPPPPSRSYPLSLHDALPISLQAVRAGRVLDQGGDGFAGEELRHAEGILSKPVRRVVRRHDATALTIECHTDQDRKSTRLNSSHRTISYAVFCLKKKKN